MKTPINFSQTAYVLTRTTTMFTQKKDIADIDFSIDQLVNTAEKLTSELRLYETLIRKRTGQIHRLNDSSFKEILNKFSSTQQNEIDAKELYKKLSFITDVLEKFDAFSHSDETLIEDVLQEYINYLQSKNENLLIIKPNMTNFLINAQHEETNTFFSSANTEKFEHLIFILHVNSHYSSVLLTKGNTSVYHYDLKGKKNHEWAERLIFKLREYFVVDQITHFECRIKDVPSSAFLLENMMKIVYSPKKTPMNDDSASQLIKLPPQCDRLILIVARKYIQIKFSQINDLTIYKILISTWEEV